MTLLTPASLSQVWNITHGVTPFFGAFQPGYDVQVAPNALLRAGRYEQSGADPMGCTLIIFDPATGEPLTFVSHTMVTAANDNFLGVYHFPAEHAVVLFGTSQPSTGTLHRVYGQRVEYDVGAGTLTPGPLATWSPNSGTNDKTTYAADVPDSNTINVFAWGFFNATSCTLDLAAGSAGTPTDYTVAAVVGAGYTDFSTGVAGKHSDGVALLAAYGAGGVTTAHTFVIPFGAAPGTAIDTGLGRLTSASIAVPLSNRTLLTSVGFGFAGGTDRFLDGSGLTTAAASAARADATIWASSPQWTHRAADSHLVAYNREGATFNAFNVLRAREYDPASGAEVAAWEYPSTYAFYGQVGMLTATRRFWWAVFGSSATQFRVYEDYAWVPPAGNPWSVGPVAAWGSTGAWH